MIKIILFYLFYIFVFFIVVKPKRIQENLKNKDDEVIFVCNEDYEFYFKDKLVSLVLVDDDEKILIGYKSNLLKNWKLRKIKETYQFFNGKDVYYLKVNPDEDYPVRIMYKNYDYYINIQKGKQKNNILHFTIKYNNIIIGEIEEKKENEKTKQIKIKTSNKLIKNNVQLLTAIFTGFLIDEALENKKWKDYDNEPDFVDKKFDEIFSKEENKSSKDE